MPPRPSLRLLFSPTRHPLDPDRDERDDYGAEDYESDRAERELSDRELEPAAEE